MMKMPKISVLENTDVFMDLYDTLTQVGVNDTTTNNSSDLANIFVQNFHGLSAENRVVVSLLMSSSTKMPFETYFFFEIMSEEDVATSHYHTSIDLYGIYDTKKLEHWSQRQKGGGEEVSLLILEYAKYVCGTKEQQKNLKKDGSKRKKIERILKPYLNQGITSVRGKGYKFEDWSFFREAVLSTIQNKISELKGKTRLRDDLLTHNPLNKIALNIEHHKGLCHIDISQFTDANIDYIKREPNKALDEIKEIILSELTLSEQLQRDLIVRYHYDEVNDDYDDIYNTDNKKLICFTGRVAFIKKLIHKHGHLFVRLSIEFNGSSMSNTLSATAGTMYLKPCQLDEYRLHSGSYEILAIVNKVSTQNPGEQKFMLDVQSLTIPPSDKPTPVRAHIEKYRQRMQEVGFDQNFSDLIATIPLEGRALMCKSAVLSLVSNFDDHGRALHTLIIGDPGAGKSRLIRWIRDNVKCANFIPCEGSSGTLVSRVIDEGNGRRLMKGPFAEDDGEYILADEFQTIDSACYDDILNLLDLGETRIKKWSYDVPFYSKRPVIAVGNPQGKKTTIYRATAFDRSIPAIDQFGLTDNMMRRFDLKIAVLSDDMPLDTARKMRLGVWKREYHSESHDKVYTAEEFCSILWHVKSLTPKFDADALDETSHWATQENSNNAHLIAESLQRIAVQFAKLRLSHTVRVEDLERAKEIMSECVQTHQKRSM
jgi:hypothetical protein